jgi:hypothetical protein
MPKMQNATTILGSDKQQNLANNNGIARIIDGANYESANRNNWWFAMR